MKIRAAVLQEMGRPAPYSRSRPLSIQNVELDAPGPGEVLLQIKMAGLCHSDLSVINGDRPRVMPMVLGHESSAEVVGVGPDVKGLACGDHVVTIFVPTCGRCQACLSGRPALCEPGAKANTEGILLTGARRLSQEGQALNHHLGVSSFAQYAVVSEASCIKIHQELSHREAALFGCAVLTGAGAIINTAQVKPGDSTAIVGLGGVGLSALLATVAAGAQRIVAIDFNDHKLQLAKTLGATHTINPQTLTTEADIIDAAEGPVDFAYDAAGSASAFSAAYTLTRRGGLTISSGLPHPGARFPLPLAQLVADERHICGSYLGSGIPARDIHRFINLYQAGKLPVDQLLGETFTLDTINEGFDHLASGSSLRNAVTIS